MTIAAIIVAAGRGTRAGGDIPKQWQDLNGVPVIMRTVAALRTYVQQIVVVINSDDINRWSALNIIVDHVVIGGATRDASVRAGLNALAATPPKMVLIHDAARPLVSGEIIQNVIEALQTSQAAAPALLVTDALWTGSNGMVNSTQDRTELYRAQTPQGFHYGAIMAAHAELSGLTTDDVAVAHVAGIDVAIVKGDPTNIKITTADDFSIAAKLLGNEMDVRCGNGYDVHKFCDGDHVWLCGVKIPHTRSLEGHSDADVGMHAITDAIYGALGMGDIGQHFPPSDPQFKGVSSRIFLTHAVNLARNNGFSISNVDCTLVCEHPKIGPHQIAMKSAIAIIMGLNSSRISVKATTSERLGFTGREEGIAAIATTTLVKK